MQVKVKRQKFKEGSFVEIEISGNRKVFGRLLPSFQLCVYDYLVSTGVSFQIKEVINKSVLFYIGVYKAVVTSEYFKIVGYNELTQEELKRIPPSFMQSEPKIEKCVLGYYDGREEVVEPSACIGLERSAAYNDLNVIQRIEDYYAGKKNISVERNKVMLNREDPRYMNPNAMWSFKEEKFYKLK
ncbi:MAG: hypothetical protein ABJB11_20860 [Ferruginibacter sp.]